MDGPIFEKALSCIVEVLKKEQGHLDHGMKISVARQNGDGTTEPLYVGKGISKLRIHRVHNIVIGEMTLN